MERFKEVFTHYFLPNEQTLEDVNVLGHTTAAYEFDMWLMPSTKDEWFALVEHPDSGRAKDIAETIYEEYGARIEGWCVLKQYRKRLKKDLLPVDASEQDVFEYATVYSTIAGSTWLLKVASDVNNPLFEKILHEKPSEFSIRPLFREATDLSDDKKPS